MISWCCQSECTYSNDAYYCKSCGAKKIMAKMWEAQPIDVYKSWVDKIYEDAEDDLTKWEDGFVTSIGDWLDSGRNLSERQAEILERIYSEKTK